ncbi:AlpA family phage regulatory protein [Streptomyces sp. NPDC004539]|uniref:helix-turn-helix transcriptional regulator n=1 Tax=Streptomyces sp. NPDC004539 TaxID=3154280 RepID=UPI0033A64815
MSTITWHRPEYQGKDEQLISLVEVATLAGVTRSAVSNWRRRHDFPQPAMTAGRTVWVVRAEAEAWLAARPIRNASDSAAIEELKAREARQAAALAKTRKKLRQLQQP